MKWVIGVSGAAALAAFARFRGMSRRNRNLRGQVVLITGGSRGLGLALARQFGKIGCRLALCARDEAELARAAADLAQQGCEVFTSVCDVADRHSVTFLIEAVTRHYGVIDILINNAGEIVVSPLENLDLADFTRAMEVMFWGPVHTTLAVLPAMRARGSGHIVTVTSIGGKVSVPHLLSYSCAKAAAVAFSEGLRSEVRKFGIDVTTIVPGLMRTGSHVNALFKGKSLEESAWFGVSAGLPGLAIGADRAARLTLNAIRARRAEKALGLPAQILMYAQGLFPELVSGTLAIANSLLPAGRIGSVLTPGRDLENSHGSLYRLLTTLGRRAAHGLNQPF